jgi:hypothetical protein
MLRAIFITGIGELIKISLKKTYENCYKVFSLVLLNSFIKLMSVDNLNSNKSIQTSPMFNKFMLF